MTDGAGSTGDPVHAEVRYICRSEMVCTLQDLVEQRTGLLSWSNEMRLQRLRDSERVIRDELDMSEDEFEQQYRDYQRHLQRSHTLPEGGTTARVSRPGNGYLREGSGTPVQDTQTRAPGPGLTTHRGRSDQTWRRPHSR